MTLTWTKRDMDILRALTWHVRLLTIDQIARIWWPTTHCHRVVRRRIRKLTTSGLVERAMLTARTTHLPSAPLYEWEPGMTGPNTRDLAALIKARWKIETGLFETIIATPLTANLFGTPATRIPNAHRREHELLLADVYAHYRTQRPEEAAQWILCEIQTDLPAGLRADALLLGPQDAVTRAVESSGRCGKRHIQELHDKCATFGIPYEIW